MQRKLTVMSHVWLLYSAVILMKYSKKIIGLLFHPRPPASSLILRLDWRFMLVTM